MPITSWPFLRSLCWLEQYYNSFHFSEDNPQNLTELCCVMTTLVLSFKTICYCFRLPNCFPHHQNIWRRLFTLHLSFLNIPIISNFLFQFSPNNFRKNSCSLITVMSCKDRLRYNFRKCRNQPHHWWFSFGRVPNFFASLSKLKREPNGDDVSHNVPILLAT